MLLIKCTKKLLHKEAVIPGEFSLFYSGPALLQTIRIYYSMAMRHDCSVHRVVITKYN